MIVGSQWLVVGNCWLVVDKDTETGEVRASPSTMMKVFMTEVHTQNPTGEAEGLSEQTRDRVLERLGFPHLPTPNLAGLQTLYRAWCAGVPFDNVRKMIALRTELERPLPGGNAEEFFAHWLADGVGGTCWPTSNALFALAQAVGFEARRVAGSMRDMGMVNHGSVKVRLEGSDWLIDSSLLCNQPLPLNADIFVSSDALCPVEVEPVAGTHLIWANVPPMPQYLPCRLLVDTADHALYLNRYEVSREQSPFNQRLYARRNHPDKIIVLLGHTRFSKTAQGLAVSELTPEQLCQSLREDIGLSDQVIAQWVDSGSLDASFETPSGPEPPPLTQKPPSQRSAADEV